MSKGGDWERDVCKYLSKWIQGTEKPYIFWRGRGSGAMFTNSCGGVGENFSGDIYPVRPEGFFLTDRFSIECKSGYPKASLDKHLKCNKDDCIRDFWEQCVNDAKGSKKFPMLIYKKKGMPIPWLGISNYIFRKFYPYIGDLRYIHLYWGTTDLMDVFLFDMKEFFSIITPNMIIDGIWTNNTKIRKHHLKRKN